MYFYPQTASVCSSYTIPPSYVSLSQHASSQVKSMKIGFLLRKLIKMFSIKVNIHFLFTCAFAYAVPFSRLTILFSSRGFFFVFSFSKAQLREGSVVLVSFVCVHIWIDNVFVVSTRRGLFKGERRAILEESYDMMYRSNAIYDWIYDGIVAQRGTDWFWIFNCGKQSFFFLLVKRVEVNLYGWNWLINLL